MVCLLHEKARKGTTKNANTQFFLEKNAFLYKKVRFIKNTISFPSLIPCRISPTDDRETTERTPTQLPVSKKCYFLRLLHIETLNSRHSIPFTKQKIALQNDFYLHNQK